MDFGWRSTAGPINRLVHRRVRPRNKCLHIMRAGPLSFCHEEVTHLHECDGDSASTPNCRSFRSS